jgi:hypothetical protein
LRTSHSDVLPRQAEKTRLELGRRLTGLAPQELRYLPMLFAGEDHDRYTSKARAPAPAWPRKNTLIPLKS